MRNTPFAYCDAYPGDVVPLPVLCHHDGGVYFEAVYVVVGVQTRSRRSALRSDRPTEPREAGERGYGVAGGIRVDTRRRGGVIGSLGEGGG